MHFLHCVGDRESLNRLNHVRYLGELILLQPHIPDGHTASFQKCTSLLVWMTAVSCPLICDMQRKKSQATAVMSLLSDAPAIPTHSTPWAVHCPRR